MTPPLANVLARKLIFFGGKGGVGKSTVSQAAALALAKKGRKVLWIAFEDPHRPRGDLREISPGLWALNCDVAGAFEEYIQLKLGLGAIARVFLRNTLIQYLSKAAPGIQEVVLTGKVWYETRNYDQVVVDMPSTGYGLAMFHSTRNYSKLFRGGPVQRDALKMLDTFADPTQAGCVVLALPEEMPIAESLEMADHLRELFPLNPPGFLVNKLFPAVPSDLDPHPDHWRDPLPASTLDYARRRTLVERHNLALYPDSPETLSYWVQEPSPGPEWLRDRLAEEIGGLLR